MLKILSVAAIVFAATFVIYHTEAAVLRKDAKTVPFGFSWDTPDSSDALSSVVGLPNGGFAALTVNSMIYVFNSDNTLQTHFKCAECIYRDGLGVLADGSLVARDKTSILVYTISGQLKNKLENKNTGYSLYTQFASLPNGDLVSANGDSIKIWDLTTGTLRKTLKVTTRMTSIERLVVLPTGRLATFHVINYPPSGLYQDYAIVMWNPEDGTQKVIYEHLYADLLVLPSGDFIGRAGNKYVRFDGEGNVKEDKVNKWMDKANDMAVLPNGDFFTLDREDGMPYYSGVPRIRDANGQLKSELVPDSNGDHDFTGMSIAAFPNGNVALIQYVETGYPEYKNSYARVNIWYAKDL